MQAIRRLTILVFLVLVAAVPVLAQGPAGEMPPPPGGHRGPGGPPDPVIGMAGRALHELDLTAEQRDQIHTIVSGYVEGDLGTQLSAFRDARHAVELLVWNSTTSEGDLVAALDTTAAAGRQLELVRHQLALDVLEILTEEQRASFQELLATEPPEFGGPGGHRGHGPRGR